MYQLNKVKVYPVGFLALMLLLYIFYFHMDIGGWKGSTALEKQLNSLIQTHNTVQLHNISVDDSTFKFLSNLPKEARCERTSDFQGGSETEGYYVTTIHGHKLSVWIKRSYSYLFGNEYYLLKVKLENGL